MHEMAHFVFWFCLAGLFYTYAGYPLLAVVQGWLFPRAVQRAPFTGTVSVLIAVHNDAARLVPKLHALLEVRGADRILEILVGSDGSTDGVGPAVAALGDARIRVIEFAERRGKAAVLNQLMTLARGEVVVMMDARQILADEALVALLAPLADPAVGVVSGHLVFRRKANEGVAARGVGSYWSYEKAIRRAEARSGSVPGATGALYAIRRAYLFPISPDTILDDVLIPMQAMERGVRCIFADDALCFDDPAATAGQEQIRKRRTIAGAIQLLLAHPRWVMPWGHPIWWRFASHKIMRLFSPFFLLGLLAANGWLVEVPFFQLTLALHLLGWLAAAFGFGAERCGLRSKLIAIPYMFAALNVTTLAAWYDAACGRFTVAWRKT